MEPSPYLPTHAPLLQPALPAARADPRVRRPDARPTGRRCTRCTSRPGDPVARPRSTATPRGPPSGPRCARSSTVRRGRPAASSPSRRYRRREGDAASTTTPPGRRIAEVHGADSLAWPAELRHPDLPGRGARSASEHADAVEFHRWLQWVLDEQLAATQAEAAPAPGWASASCTTSRSACTASGADAWPLQDDVRRRASPVGAPPDPYNQNGQDWSQPPWRPDRLAEHGVRAVPATWSRAVAAQRRRACGSTT